MRRQFNSDEWNADEQRWLMEERSTSEAIEAMGMPETEVFTATIAAEGPMPWSPDPRGIRVNITARSPWEAQERLHALGKSVVALPELASGDDPRATIS